MHPPFSENIPDVPRRRRARLASLLAAGCIASLPALPSLAAEVAAAQDCAYRVIFMASGQPGADPIAVHHCFAPTSFMGSKSDEEFQTAVRPLIPSQPQQFEHVGSLPETRPDGTSGKIEIYVVRDRYPSSVYAFHVDQDGLTANIGAN